MTMQCPQCLAFLPPRAKLCSRCGNPAPPTIASAPTHEPTSFADPHAETVTADAEQAAPRAAAIAAAALAAIALLLALGYASC